MFIISLVEKLFERMLNSISILKNVTIINPQKALEFGQQKCIESFQVYIQYLACISVVLTAVTDKSHLEYIASVQLHIWLQKMMYLENVIGKPKDQIIFILKILTWTDLPDFPSCCRTQIQFESVTTLLQYERNVYSILKTN